MSDRFFEFPEKERNEVNKLLKISEISLWLDDYEDIFSDFDPRPFTMRVLSDDFINEAKKEVRDGKSGAVELVLLIPKEKRNTKHERDIKKRITEYCAVQAERLKKDSRDLVKRGLSFLVIGTIMMFMASFLLYNYDKNIIASFLIILLEPSSWFLFWEGLGQIIFDSKKKKPDLLFYEKMRVGNIIFIPY